MQTFDYDLNDLFVLIIVTTHKIFCIYHVLKGSYLFLTLK